MGAGDFLTENAAAGEQQLKKEAGRFENSIKKVPKAKRVLTMGLDNLIQSLGAFVGGDTGNKWAFHLFIIILNMVLSSINIILFFRLNADNHIIFWMGPYAGFINLAVPIVLSFVSAQLFVLNCFRLSASTVRNVVFYVFLIAGLLLIAGGVFVWVQAVGVHNDLVYSCGRSKLTAKVESEWQKIADYQRECAQIEGRGENDIFVQQCPDFEEFEKENGEMVAYIEDMEYDYGCQGFCKFWSHPLFNEEASTGERCAAAVGRDIWEVGIAIGLPTVISGWVTVLIGQVLYRYDHL